MMTVLAGGAARADAGDGQRIATNGDIRPVPTPERWDLVAKLKDQEADKAHDRLTAHRRLGHPVV